MTITTYSLPRGYMPGVDGHQSDLLSAAFLWGQPNGRWELRDGRWLVLLEAFGIPRKYGEIWICIFFIRIWIPAACIYNYIYDYIYKRQMIRYLWTWHFCNKGLPSSLSFQGLVGFRQAILRCQRDCLESVAQVTGGQWKDPCQRVICVQMACRKRLLNARSLNKIIYIYIYGPAYICISGSTRESSCRERDFPRGLLVRPNLLSRLFMAFQLPRSCDWCCFTQISTCWLHWSFPEPLVSVTIHQHTEGRD